MSINRNNIKISNDYIITTPDIAGEPSESVGSAMFTHMKKFQNNIAQIDAKTGQSDTFGALLQRCIRTALHMSRRNITRDHVVTLCTTNHLNASVPYIATQFLGAKIANVDPSFSIQEMKHLLGTVRPRMIFAIPESVEMLEKVLEDISLDSEIVVFGEMDKHLSFSEFLKPLESEETFEPVKVANLYDTAAIYFSSGTTGLPKAICQNHYSFVATITNIQHTDNLDWERIKFVEKIVSRSCTLLCYSSLYWISAGSLLLGSIVHGFPRLICEDFDAKEIWDLIRNYKLSTMILTPLQVIDMLVNKKDDIDTRSVLSIDIIGSAICKKYVLKLQEMFANADIHKGYGQTEVCGFLTLFKSIDKYHRELNNKAEKIESVGLPVRGTSYKVVDNKTKKNVGFNQNGELLVKSKFVMNGYYNSDSSDVFDEEGWLKTGDIVCYDEDFCFYFVDRIREAFKYQGWFVVPSLIESELENHPAVKMAAVTGVPKRDGYHPMGLVVLNDGFHVSEEEIEKFVEGRVTERQRLRAGVKFVKSFPLTVTGKVDRKKLREMI